MEGRWGLTKRKSTQAAMSNCRPAVGLANGLSKNRTYWHAAQVSRLAGGRARGAGTGEPVWAPREGHAQGSVLRTFGPWASLVLFPRGRFCLTELGSGV